MKQILFLLILTFSLTGCLKNLNQSEFYRKLEIKKASWYDIVYDNQEAFEASIKEVIEDEFGEVERVTFWGEGRYACGKVVTQGYDETDLLSVMGTFFVKGSKHKNRYTIQFVPEEGGKLGTPILY